MVGSCADARLVRKKVVRRVMSFMMNSCWLMLCYGAVCGKESVV